MKIRTRLFLGFIIAVAVGFYYLIDLIQEDLRPRYLEAIEDSLVDTSTILSALFTIDGENDDLDPATFRRTFDEVHRRRFEVKIYELVRTSADLRVYVTDSRGIVIFDSDGGRDEGQDYSRWNDVLLTLKGGYGARSTRNDPDNPESSVLYVASPLIVDGRTAGVLTVCKPTTSANFFLSLAKRKILTSGILSGLGIVILGIATSVWVTRPIEKLTTYARAVRDGRRRRLPKLGRSEIGMLGEAFEEMKTALEGKDYVEKYVQTLTHEIKGPLTAIRGAAELLQENVPAKQRARFLENLRTETNRIQNVVDRLLLLSSIESRKGVRDVEEINLGRLLTEAAESLRPAIKVKDLSFSADIDEGVIIRGERFLVHHGVVNLLQNAIDFSAPGGAIHASASTDLREATISVRDAGPGIPSYALPRVCERFYSLPRPDSGRKSSGLGLTFVQEVADLHGGSVSLDNLPGGGVKATLCLALSPPATAGD